MAYRIDKGLCVECGHCYAGCPVEAVRDLGDGSYAIDADRCVECGFCEQECPAGAVYSVRPSSENTA